MSSFPASITVSSGQVGAWGVAQWPKALWLTFSKPKKSRDEVTLTVLLSSLLGASEFAQALVAQSAHWHVYEGWADKLIVYENEIIPDLHFWSGNVLGNFSLYGSSPYPANASIDSSSGRHMQIHTQTHCRSEQIDSWDMPIWVFGFSTANSMFCLSMRCYWKTPSCAQIPSIIRCLAKQATVMGSCPSHFGVVCILIPSACSLFGTLGYHHTPTNPLSQNAGMLARSCRGTQGWGGHNTSGEAVGAIVPATRMCVFTNGNSGCSGLGGMDFKMEPWVGHIGWGTGKRHVDCRLFTTAPDGFVLLPWRIWRGVWWVSPWRLRREGLSLPSRCVSELLQQVTLLNFARWPCWKCNLGFSFYGEVCEAM